MKDNNDTEAKELISTLTLLRRRRRSQSRCLGIITPLIVSRTEQGYLHDIHY